MKIKVNYIGNVDSFGSPTDERIEIKKVNGKLRNIGGLSIPF